MPDRRRAPAFVPPRPVDPLVAAARVVEAARSSTDKVFRHERWQTEAWGFYDDLGEFRYGITWRANALSRVRLTAAELVPGGDEPEPLTEGPAADLVEQLGGGTAGRAAVMRAFGVQLGVPGEGWLVADRVSKRVPLEQANWSVRSTDEIRDNRQGGFEVRADDSKWEPLPSESLVCRVWDPHPRLSWRANSAAKAAIPVMREIELYNRRIIATMVSRLAMNGVLLIPQEGTITTPEAYQDEADPFVAMLVDIAGHNIREPGSASASIPIPIRFSSELIEKWRHLTFGDGVDDGLLDARDKAIGRLATTLDMPAEVLRGVAAANHWTAWQISEDGIKLHISPPAELIVNGLTVGFLHPMLKAAGEEPVGPNGGKVVVWYDPSELTARPDKSTQALSGYDRLEVSGAAMRRESGLDESDAPDGEELKTQILKKLVTMPANALQALAELTGQALAPQAPVPGDSPGASGGTDGPAPPAATAPGTGAPPAAPPATPPGRNGSPPTPPGPSSVAAVAAQLLAGFGEPAVVNGHRHGGGKHRARSGPRRRG